MYVLGCTVIFSMADHDKLWRREKRLETTMDYHGRNAQLCTMFYRSDAQSIP